MITIETMNSLPEYCWQCPCHDRENGQCQADAEKRYTIEYRPYWCPLKEITQVKTKKDAIAVKPYRKGRIWLCGNCGSYVGFEDHDENDPNDFYNYCHECGTKVEWDESHKMICDNSCFKGSEELELGMEDNTVDEKVNIEFTKEEFDKIMKYMDAGKFKTVQDAIVNACINETLLKNMTINPNDVNVT